MRPDLEKEFDEITDSLFDEITDSLPVEDRERFLKDCLVHAFIGTEPVYSDGTPLAAAWQKEKKLLDRLGAVAARIIDVG